MKRNVIFLGLLLFLSTPAFAQRQWTLDECMDYAIAHNKQAQHLQNEQQRRKINVQASKDARLPRFEGDMGGYVLSLHHAGDGNKFNANQSLINMGVSGAVPLYTGNRLSSQIKASKYALMAVEEEMRSTDKDIKVQVAAAFLQVCYDKGEVAIARKQQDISRLLLQQARSLYEKGKRPESDVVEAEAMVSRDDALLTAAEGDVTLALLDLKLLLDLPDSIDFDICEPTGSIEILPLIDSHNSYTRTSSSHPAVRSASYGIQSAEQTVKVARSGYYPTLSLVGHLGTIWTNISADASHSGHIPMPIPLGKYDKFNYTISSEIDWKRKNFLTAFLGLSLNIPIFNAFETRARIRSAKVDLEDARISYEDAQQQVRKKISQAWQGAVTAQSRYEAEVKSEESSALAYRYAQKRYDAGMITLFDLTQSRQQWFTAAENALRMKYEYLIRRRILDIQTQ